VKTKILRLEDVKHTTGLARTTIYDQVARGEFPRPIKIGTRAIGWIDEEIEGWVQDRVSARDSSGPSTGRERT